MAAAFATTIDYSRHPLFASRATLIPHPNPGCPPQDIVRGIGEILRAARRHSVLLLTSSWGHLHLDMQALALMGAWPARSRPTIILMGCMWEPNRGPRHLVERLMVRLADRAITGYIVQSSDELSLFPATWQVDPRKVRFCPYHYTLGPGDLAEPRAATAPFVFAGGNSHREYLPLVEAAAALPWLPFKFATHLLDSAPSLPPNVSAGSVPHREFMRLMQESSAVAVPIRRGMRRAAGQQTYLNAMWLRKPVIVTDTPGVRDYVESGTTGWIVDGSSDTYVRCLQTLFHPDQTAEREALGQRAHDAIHERFSFDAHVRRLLALVDAFAGDN